MLAALEPGPRGQHQRAALARRIERVGERMLGAARRDNHRDSRARGLLRRLELGRHPAAAERPGAVGHQPAHPGLGVGDQRNQSRVGPLARVAGEHAGHVAQDHQQLRLHHPGHQRREHVVVAHADLFDRDGVVLVDDRNHAGCEQRLDRMDRVAAALALGQVLMGQQELRDRASDGAEGARPLAHQLDLAGRRRRLARRHVRRRRLQPRAPGRDRARRHQHDFASRAHDRVDLAARRSITSGRKPSGVGEHGAADLDHEPARGAMIASL